MEPDSRVLHIWQEGPRLPWEPGNSLAILMSLSRTIEWVLGLYNA